MLMRGETKMDTINEKYYVNVKEIMENNPRLLTGDAEFITRVVIDTCQE